MHYRTITPVIPILSAVFFLVACSKSDSGAADTARATAAASAQGGTGIGSPSGTDHSSMTSTPARDPDQEFVRMMVDHHQGMIALADAALAKNPSEHTAVRARDMRRKQLVEQTRMVAMLKKDYGEDKMPMLMESNARMISEVASRTGVELDRTFRERAVAHHEEALEMITDYETKLTKPAVRTWARQMKVDQQKEISELRSELGKM